jgi:hypothetical protein
VANELYINSFFVHYTASDQPSRWVAHLETMIATLGLRTTFSISALEPGVLVFWPKMSAFNITFGPAPPCIDLTALLVHDSDSESTLAETDSDNDETQTQIEPVETCTHGFHEQENLNVLSKEHTHTRQCRS